MKLTERLLGYLNRVFDKDPGRTLALRLRYDGAMSWVIQDGILTTTVTGGSGSGVSIDLAAVTVAELGANLAALPGYTVEYQDLSTFSGLSALVLLDARGNQDESNGDHLYGYTSVLWSYIEAIGNQLTLIRASIAEALLQMSASTASGEWVDEHGSYYKVPRNFNEVDAAYAARIISEVVKARGNNVAIGEAIRSAVSATSVQVDDWKTVTVAADTTESYGLFDVTVDSYLDVPMAAAEDALVRQVIEVMRDAGTHLRRLKYIRRSKMPVYVGAMVRIGEEVTVGSEALTLDGSWILDGSEELDGLA